MIEAVRTLAGLFEVNTGLVGRALEGLSSTDLLQRPGDKGNSMFWIFGHLTYYRYGICNYMGMTLEQPYGDLFSRGSQLEGSEAYPPMEEIQELWKTVSTQLKSCFGQVTQKDLEKPVDRSFPGVSQTVQGAISFLHFHECYHVGQLAYIRRLLGQSQLVG